jgi:putative PIN family toxin of toxin-antitoxin system
MNRVVLDTNVIVSGLINRAGKPGLILNAVAKGRIFPVVSIDMMKEYQDIITGRDFNYSKDEALAVLLLFGRVTFSLPEPGVFKGVPEDDAVFVSAAIAGGADYLITGNIKHFPQKKYGKCMVVTPAEFLGSGKFTNC